MRRHALIVGGCGGVGAVLADALLDDGWQLTLAGRRTRSPALEARGAAWVAADCSVPAQARALIAQVEPFDALILALGTFRRVPLAQETWEGWREQLDNNLDPVFLLGQAALPGLMALGWGRVLTFALATSHRLAPSPRATAHAVAKAGVLLLTRTFAQQAAPAGVTVNCLSLGVLESEALQIAPRVPAGRLGQPQDVVGAARFLLSDAASWVTGADLLVSGGWGI